MTEQVLTFHGMHADHRNWHTENELWQGEIALWQRQHEMAISNLQSMEEIVHQHQLALQEHAEAIARQEKSHQEHERGMAAYMSEGAGAELQEAMVKNHRQQDVRHQQHHVAHETLKKRHHALMAHLAMLKAAMHEVQ